jgi:hypothetical protein
VHFLVRGTFFLVIHIIHTNPHFPHFCTFFTLFSLFSIASHKKLFSTWTAFNHIKKCGVHKKMPPICFCVLFIFLCTWRIFLCAGRAAVWARRVSLPCVLDELLPWRLNIRGLGLTACCSIGSLSAAAAAAPPPDAVVLFDDTETLLIWIICANVTWNYDDLKNCLGKCYMRLCWFE